MSMNKITIFIINVNFKVIKNVYLKMFVSEVKFTFNDRIARVYFSVQLDSIRTVGIISEISYIIIGSFDKFTNGVLTLSLFSIRFLLYFCTHFKLKYLIDYF